MPGAGTPSDRTLTAMLGAPDDGAPRGRPVLLLAARAGAGGPDVADGVRVAEASIELGRGGRDDSGRVALDDPLASSRHARVAPEGDGWAIEDLGSKNGTTVDGARISTRVRLAGGERIFIGSHLLVFRFATAGELDAVAADRERPLAPVPTISPRLASLSGKLRRLAATNAELLLAGETGVGKEVYARAVHAASGRGGRFVAINCAALPRELVEGELFGWRAGAHSTAHAAKPGLLEEADGGTLFLDEIGEMPAEAQAKLLRFLQDGEVTPLGATRPRRVDVRVVAATNRLVRSGAGGPLREDLLGRLGATAFVLPPLRDRIEDLGALSARFLADARGRGDAVAGFELRALRALATHTFPLNVRELQKMIASAAALARPDRPDSPPALIDLTHLPDDLGAPPLPADPPPSGAAASRARKSPEPAPSREELAALLDRHGGNVAEVSRALGRQRAAVWRWMKRFGLGRDG